MRINFQITSTPIEDQKQYFIAYLEGVLKIFLKGELFFNSSDILVAELGLNLKNWIDTINSGSLLDFHYETMDSDENPILSFKYKGKEGFIIESPWQEFEASDIIVKKENLIQEVKAFLKKLDKELDEQFNLKLEDLMS